MTHLSVAFILASRRMATSAIVMRISHAAVAEPLMYIDRYEQKVQR